MADNREFRLTSRQHSIVLFALRYMQSNIDELNEEEAIADSDYFKDDEGNSTLGEDVTSDEMDELAEYFNCEMEIEEDKA